MGYYVRALAIPCIAVVILCVSACLDLRWCHSHLTDFGRSGALVTALSLFFAIWGYERQLEAGARPVATAAREYFWKKDSDESTATEAGQLLVEDYLVAASRVEKHITLIYATVVAVGTLVWGFGDLVPIRSRCEPQHVGLTSRSSLGLIVDQVHVPRRSCRVCVNI
jgi:hypothetical protein